MVALVASYGRASTRSHREYTRCSEKCSIWRQFALSFPARALNCAPLSLPHRGVRHRRNGNSGFMRRCAGLSVLAVAVALVIPGASSSAGAGVPDASASAASPAPTWRWPLPAPHVLARTYIAPENPYGAGHRGIDIVSAHSAVDVRVASPASGTVHYVGFVVDRPVVSIDHGGGVLSSFEPVASTLRKGDRVVAGQDIGTLEPGHCANPCLHLGARVNGEYVSPLLFLGGMPRAVLLPTRTLTG